MKGYTLKDIKYLTQNIVKLKKDGFDNQVVTIDEIYNETYVSYYHKKENIKTMLGSLYIDEQDELLIVYPVLETIKINNETSFSPCGDTKQLETLGYFNIMSKNLKGEVKLLDTEITTVNAIYTNSNNEYFQLSSNKLTCCNNTMNRILTTIITASYRHMRVKKIDSIQFTQDISSETDWLFDKSEVESIELVCSPANIGSNGGNSIITVNKHFIGHYHKEDMCGNIIATTIKSQCIEDITNDCELSINKSNTFSIEGNVITFKKQETDSEENICLVTALYGDLKSIYKIKQECGEKSYNDFELTFENQTTYQEIQLTNKDNIIEVPFISKKNTIARNQIIDSSWNYNVCVMQSDTWYEAYIEDNLIKINIFEINSDKSNDRIGDIIINNGMSSIQLTLIQPINKPFKSRYTLQIDYDEELTINSVKTSQILLKPLKIDYYTDGSIEEFDILDTSDYIDVNYSSSDQSILSCGKPIQIDAKGNTILKPRYANSLGFEDVVLNVTTCVKSKISHEKLSDEYSITLTLKGLENTKEIGLNVFIYSSSIKEDLVSNEEGILKVIDYLDNKLIMVIPLTIVWLYNGIEHNMDIAFSGNIKLEENKIYSFMTENFFINGEEINYKEEFNIKDNIDINITI